jgi:outer membrane receptor protein involved in Fe transport
MLGAAASVIVGLAAAADVRQTGAELEEVVVTATRREDTIHNVPMSIAAVTAAAIENLGLTTGQDLARVVPALRISPTSGSLGAAAFGSDVAIRGISSSSGAPTTGVYIDDVPLMVRRLSGAMAGGIAFPQLFDLDRVEVLRGPQGTLFGSSSEGGTIRFITRQPSFTEFSGSARSGWAMQEHGSPSYELGATANGPIIGDKLAVSVTAWQRRDGGYVDHISRFTGATIAKDSNSTTRDHLQAKLAWKSERAKLGLSYLYSRNVADDSDQFFLNVPQMRATVGPAGQQTTYTYGPYNFYGPYTTAMNTNIGDNFYRSDGQLSPLPWTRSDQLGLTSGTFDYDFGKMTVKLMSSYLLVNNKANPNYALSTPVGRGGTGLFGGNNALPDSSPFIANLPYVDGPSRQNGRIEEYIDELRFASNNSDSRLSWVAGLYYNSTKVSAYADQYINLTDLINATAIGTSTSSPIALGFVQVQNAKEVQSAAFGEATVKITEKLHATAGVRFSRNEFSYKLQQAGPILGLPASPLTNSVDARTSENATTPKFGLQYVVNDNYNVYATAAKGTRPGGVNFTIPPICAAALALAGFPNGAPAAFNSDSLTSYELGSKMRALDGRLKFNASAYRIDWDKVQANITLSCGSNFNANAAKAVSQGFDIDAAYQILPGLTLSGTLAYTDAKYKGAVRSNPTTTLIEDGDRIPFISKWSGTFSTQYNFRVASFASYIRADYQYQGNFTQTLGPTTTSYAPDMFLLPGTKYLSARAGLTFDKWDVALSVQNLTASTDRISTAGMANVLGRGSCLNAPTCTSYVRNAPAGFGTTFRPRTWGITGNYKF